jgi:UDP-N-acetylglucosamine 1-carboxyvinyltransferase
VKAEPPERRSAGRRVIDKSVIRGGRPLLGTIRVSGAKNSALPCMSAAILTEDEVMLERIPQVRDIETERKLLVSTGAEWSSAIAGHSTGLPSCWRLLSDPTAKYEIVKTMRASWLVLGRLVARCGLRDRDRPIDLHLKGLELMGATIAQEHGYLEARADRLKVSHIVFDNITVTATEDLLMAAVLAEGETLMENCTDEPEVSDLAALLIAMGAKIEGAGTATIRLQGVYKLHGARHRINPDRIEAGSFLIAGAITGGDLVVANCQPAHLSALTAKLEAVGIRIDSLGPESLRVRSEGNLRAVDISTEVYPGFPTDMQAQFMALVTQAEGTSIAKENIFENRFMHVGELVRMGPNIKVEGRTAIVRGKTPLSAAAVMCSDLRASASLILATLVADGESILDRVYHADRGYERLEENLRGVGAQMRRMGDLFPTGSHNKHEPTSTVQAT